MICRPILSQYWVRTVAAEDRTGGGIWLPEQAQERNQTDAVVLDAGPGRDRPMQARPLDRILFQAHDFRTIDDDDREGFVRDEKIVGVIPGPDYNEIIPANDYVLIQRDPWQLNEMVGKIIVSRDTARSGYSRWLQRGEELHHELNRAIEQHFRRSGQITVTMEDKKDYCHRLFTSLCPEDQAAVRESVERKGETDWKYHTSPSTAQRPTRGRIRDWGRSAVIVDEKHPVHTDKPWSTIETDDVVVWDRIHERIDLGGDRILIRAEYLAAVEVE